MTFLPRRGGMGVNPQNYKFLVSVFLSKYLIIIIRCTSAKKQVLENKRLYSSTCFLALVFKISLTNAPFSGIIKITYISHWRGFYA